MATFRSEVTVFTTEEVWRDTCIQESTNLRLGEPG